MKILGIDSSGLVASAALISDGSLLAEYTVDYKKTHSQTLLPMIDTIVKMTECELDSLDAIAVAQGPGSFTGLRIGSATAKGLALALQKPIVPVPTLEGLSFNLAGTNRLVCPMMDARRNQVYTGLYEVFPEGVSPVVEQQAVSLEAMLDTVNRLGREVIFLGDGAAVYEERIKEGTRVPFTFAPPHLFKQRAGSVAALGLIYLKEGRTESAAEHKPFYLRMSQAERERKEREVEKC